MGFYEDFKKEQESINEMYEEYVRNNPDVLKDLDWRRYD